MDLYERRGMFWAVFNDVLVQYDQPSASDFGNHNGTITVVLILTTDR